LKSTDRFVICGVLAVSAGVVYVNALRNPFIYDDYHTVVYNASIARLADLRAIVLHDVTRPIVNFSYAADHAIWGAGPFGFHLTSVLLHMLNVVLLWQLAWTLTGKSRVATAAAALFAVHPMMTEAVGYISGRSEVVCALWFLAAFLAGRRWLDRGGAAWLIAMLAFWIAALASKETAAMFPFVFAAYGWSSGTGSFGPGRRLVVYAMIAFTVLAGVVRLYVLARVEHPGSVAIHWPFLLLDVDVIARYLLLMIRPAGQSIFHSVALPSGVLDPRALLSIAAVAAVLAFAWRLRRSEPVAALGLFWFLALLVPSSVLILVDQGEPMTEHRVYIASLGLFLAAGVGVDRAGAWLSRIGEKQAAFGVLAFRLVLLSFAFMTVLRNAVWSDPILLYQESVNLAPTHYRPRLLLGEAMLDHNQRDDAMKQFWEATRLRPEDPTAYIKLARCYADVGKFSEARVLFLKARELNPADASVTRMLEALARMQARLKPSKS
jgi:hypothetical protein